MRRRDAMLVLSGAVVGWPLAAWAQEPLRRPLIGLLSPITREAAKANVEAFRGGL
jgi:hypothetical protein